MAISRAEMKEYFTHFDFEVDKPSASLACFQCGEMLYYKNSRYRCDNGHSYTYHNLVMEHAKMMYGLTVAVVQKNVCKNGY